jgi:hypothetical protein
MRMFRTLAALMGAGAAALSLACLGAAPASAATGQSLTPDPFAYCIENPPFGLQQQVNGWQVQFINLTGASGQNNWGCRYAVSATVPTGDDDFTLPPFFSTQPMDWNGMCNQQFPGAHAQWVQLPLTGVAGAPWQCIGAAGVIYDPAEQADGTHQVLGS